MRRAELQNRNDGTGASRARQVSVTGWRALLAVPALAIVLAGCSGGGIGGGNGLEGPMGSGDAGGQGGLGSEIETTTVAPTGQSSRPTTPAPRTVAAGSTMDVVGAGNVPAGTQPHDASDFSCPRIQVRGGAGSWQVTESGAEGGVRYQATLGQFARECRYTTPEMNMRIGIQGRVLLGAKGGPGKVNVPLRLAVVKEGPVPESIWTKFYSVPVEIGPGVMQVDFGLVADDVNFPRPDPATLDKYVVYVGFDPQGAAAAERPTRTRPAQQQTRPRPAQAAPQATRPAAPAPAATAPTPVRVAPAAQSTPVQAAPLEPAPVQAAPTQAAPPPAATAPAPAASSGDTQWIGAPAPSTGTFSQ